MKAGTYIAISVAAVFLVAALFLGGFFAGRATRKPTAQTDTVTTVVTIRDTITQYKPEYITKTVIRRELVEVTDTVTINDTTYIALPFERREYSDSNYRAVVTGYRPELESISVYPKTQIITQTVTRTVQVPERKRWGVGVQAGFGGFYGISSKRVDYGPYMGVGVSYNIVRW